MRISQVLFFMTAACTTVFIITILAMVAMLVGEPEAPANVWFNVHGAMVMTIEVISIGVIGMAAMIADRCETIREFREAERRKEDLSANPDEKLTSDV